MCGHRANNHRLRGPRRKGNQAASRANLQDKGGPATAGQWQDDEYAGLSTQDIPHPGYTACAHAQKSEAFQNHCQREMAATHQNRRARQGFAAKIALIVSLAHCGGSLASIRKKRGEKNAGRLRGSTHIGAWNYDLGAHDDSLKTLCHIGKTRQAQSCGPVRSPRASTVRASCLGQNPKSDTHSERVARGWEREARLGESQSNPVQWATSGDGKGAHSWVSRVHTFGWWKIGSSGRLLRTRNQLPLLSAQGRCGKKESKGVKREENRVLWV